MVILSPLNITSFSFDIASLAGFAVLILLLFFSAMISGSEVAFFSLKPIDLEKFKQSASRKSQTVLHLLDEPKGLLATILVANNFVNIGIVILSTYLTHNLISDALSPILTFLLEIVAITLLLLLFGEIIPKVYANQFSVGFSRAMALPLTGLKRFFSPVSYLLISFSSIIDKRIEKKNEISIDELSDALEITAEGISDDKDILKGIVEFGSTEVSEIMRPRVDVVALDLSASFYHVLNVVNDGGYSRIPVYQDSFDNIKGILYIKDLLPHIQKSEGYEWQKLLRTPYFVPEKKKINDLLKELQQAKIHLAIVVDEYGGTSGIVTMEDIIEEIVGDISDEFDEDNIHYTKINENNFLLDGKILLNDLCRLLELDGDFFDEIRGEADTLAGLILEVKGDFPKQYDKIRYKQFTFSIEEVDRRRIVKIKLTIS